MPTTTSATASTSDPTAGLSGAGLACRRGRRLLFSGLDLALAPGSITWLRGPNGSGKTSLMRLLAGLAQPESGEIAWRGRSIRADRAAWQADLVYIGHTNALKDDLTLLEALMFLAALRGQGREAAERALGELGLAQRLHQPVRTLSQGQRRRGALARLALSAEAATPGPAGCWILDEPYDALDRAGRQRLDELVLAQAARGGVVLLTSHQDVHLPGLVEFNLADRVAAPAPRTLQ